MMFKWPCGFEFRKKSFVATSSMLKTFFFAKMPGLYVKQLMLGVFKNLFFKHKVSV